MTLDEVRAMLTPGLDTALEVHSACHGGMDVLVRFCRAPGDDAVSMYVSSDEVRIVSTSGGRAGFLALADAYTRAAAFVRATGLAVR